MTRTRSIGTMPRDVRTRERLREAQDTEARAVTAVDAAHARLADACRKRDEAMAVAGAAVAQAEAALAVAQGNLVGISGLDRAALLLGADKASLRKAAAAATNSGGGEA